MLNLMTKLFLIKNTILIIINVQKWCCTNVVLKKKNVTRKLDGSWLVETLIGIDVILIITWRNQQVNNHQMKRGEREGKKWSMSVNLFLIATIVIDLSLPELFLLFLQFFSFRHSTLPSSTLCCYLWLFRNEVIERVRDNWGEAWSPFQLFLSLKQSWKGKVVQIYFSRRKEK